jgi:hypothetical protein
VASASLNHRPRGPLASKAVVSATRYAFFVALQTLISMVSPIRWAKPGPLRLLQGVQVECGHLTFGALVLMLLCASLSYSQRGDARDSFVSLLNIH